ncbi:MAG: hypothetical protein L0Z62_43225 [Gemmataceae bacterium]|nr:hypothetical protein [Gemmataceae bacterium]
MSPRWLTRWTVLTAASLALLAPPATCVACAQVAQAAQHPAAAQGTGEPAGGKIYTNKTAFQLPIRIEDRARGNLREVVLWVKTGSGQWMRADSVHPTQKEFFYKAAHDGEHWFSVVTVDHAGLTNPRDVAQEPPQLVVVVDTVQPNAELQAATVSGQTALRCQLIDANPEPASIKASAKGPDQSWRPLEPLAGQPGYFRAGPEVYLGWVRVTASDRAGNQTTREVNLKELFGLTSPNPPLPGGDQGGVAPAAQGPVLPAGGPVASPPKGNGEGVVHATHQVAKSAPLPGSEQPGPALATPPAPKERSVPPQPPAAAAQGSKGSPGQRQLINNKHAQVTYRVDPIGPSGVGKVEIWMTVDKGASWQKVGEDADRRSPAEVDLPGEGLYGLRLVVANGNGFGGTPPNPGDEPSIWIEVDTAAPTAQLRDIDPNATGGTLEVRWLVNDKNLGETPIKLSYATRREGPWLPIANGVRNDGTYRWEFPRDAGGQFFVRLEATDQAGNVTRCETPMPVALDLTEPKAQVVGVTSGGTGSAP